ncbi:hypothetical protein ZIOFF_053442 [Zingiber officinale]|uniref:Uncharacterized protein n=1 Tax=Zingiber officinale TaxID=94328 RepID=A0A8J5FD60_ZINOF|nr:hypothetical protein ZIOFF_053442 [Zingiber officinale]
MYAVLVMFPVVEIVVKADAQSCVLLLRVCACMQHKIEMDKRDGKFVDHPVMAAPPFQQMSRLDHPLPPNVGYPPPPPPPPQYAQPYACTTTTIWTALRVSVLCARLSFSEFVLE